jgi:hypothetical protein
MATDEKVYDHVQTMEMLTLAFKQFANIAAHISDEEVKQASDAVHRADAFGFVIDPTKYQRALATGSLKQQADVIALFTKTKAELKRLFPQGWPD